MIIEAFLGFVYASGIPTCSRRAGVLSSNQLVCSFEIQEPNGRRRLYNEVSGLFVFIIIEEGMPYICHSVSCL